jgi:hypothetical protein
MLATCGLCAGVSGADPRTPLIDPTQAPPGYGAGRTDAAAGGAPPLPTEPVHLQMIARNGTLRLAVVNGRSVHTGDSLTVAGKSITVVAIGDESVVVEQDGRRQTLELVTHSGLSPLCATNASHRPSCRNDLPGASR